MRRRTPRVVSFSADPRRPRQCLIAEGVVRQVSQVTIAFVALRKSAAIPWTAFECYLAPPPLS